MKNFLSTMGGLGMEKEIYISKKDAPTQELIKKLNELAEFVKQKYNANIWFVEILGKRHSYIAGHRDDSFLPPEVVYINDRYAVVSNEWERISEKNEVLSTIKMLILTE